MVSRCIFGFGFSGQIDFQIGSRIGLPGRLVSTFIFRCIFPRKNASQKIMNLKMNLETNPPLRPAPVQPPRAPVPAPAAQPQPQPAPPQPLYPGKYVSTAGWPVVAKNPALISPADLMLSQMSPKATGPSSKNSFRPDGLSNVDIGVKGEAVGHAGFVPSAGRRGFSDLFSPATTATTTTTTTTTTATTTTTTSTWWERFLVDGSFDRLMV